MVCIFIATALWFLNALSKDYSTTISYPVKYVNAPDQKFLANVPPSKLDLKVDAHGFTLLRHKLSFTHSPIILSLSSITEGLTPQNRTYEVVSSRHLKRIASQVRNEITVREVQPELLYIVLDSLKTKDIALKAAVDMDFKSQYKLKQALTLNPSSVQITGPATIVDTIDFLYTEPTVYKELDASVNNELTILFPEKTTIIPEKTWLEIEVEKFTEKELKIPIQVLNKPDSIKLKLFPSEIKVSCLVGLSEFDNILPTDFTATVNYDSINTNTPKTTVSVEYQTSQIEIRRFSPESVEYLIENY
jgi:hypothetical protein